MALLFVSLAFMVFFGLTGLITLVIGAAAQMDRWHSFAIGVLLGPAGIIPMLVVAARRRPPEATGSMGSDAPPAGLGL